MLSLRQLKHISRPFNRFKIVLVASLYITLVLAYPNNAGAQVTNSDLRSIINDTVHLDKNAQDCYLPGGSSTGLSPSIPDPWRSLIETTAPLYPDADPRLVAATLWAENRGWPEYKESGWAVSEAAAQGPWQFIPGTWASMGHDGDGDGIKDPNNPKDAVHAAFKHQLGSTGKPILINYSGSAQEAFETLPFYSYRAPGDQWSLMTYMGKYNGSGAPNNTTLSNFPRGQNSDYVIMGFWLISSDFVTGWNPEAQSFVDASTYGELDEAVTGSLAVSGQCPTLSDGVGRVNADGYAFPIAANKESVYAGWPLPCNTSSCHHDGTPAFDFSISNDDRSAGIAVYAITSGVIENFKNTYSGQVGCQTFQLKGDDGWYYWYGHIQGVTKAGQKVSAGEKVATIGERRCTGNGSYPHLHIDRGSPKGEYGGSVCCRDSSFIDLINTLYEEL